jgi:Integrase core domain
MELWQMDIVGGVKLEDARPPRSPLTASAGRTGIRHLLTAPYSPSTTGKVEPFHKTLRAGCLRGQVFADVGAAQAAVDAWVTTYNTERPHPPAPEPGKGLGITRWVEQSGRIGLGSFKCHVGLWLAGEMVEILAHDGVLTVAHRSVVVATHTQRLRPGKTAEIRPAASMRKPQLATSGMTVTRTADASGYVSFAGTGYRAGRAPAGKSVEVSLAAGSVQLAVAGKVVRIHPARHDHAREHGAFATPKGRPRKKTGVAQKPDTSVREVPDTKCRSGTGT